MSRSEYARSILLRTAVTLLAASFLLYALTHIIPGDPIRALFGFRPPPPVIDPRVRTTGTTPGST